jgi:glycogenin glucosyltransferase
MSSEAFVTLATNDGYALGALVLAQSIRKVGTQRRLVIMISNSLSDLIRRTLETSFDEVVVVSELNSNDDEHLRLLSRPELGVTFTKINCWLLEKYSKCVFLDADCIVLREIDDLFQREELSASPDAGWPDCFNSGVFVFEPSKETYRKLVEFASQQDASFDGGDQGLLNAFFSSWRSADISRHLPFTYNVTSNTFYSYVPAITQFRNDIRVVHFAGALKPWQLTYNPQNQQLSGNLSSQHDIQREFLLSWWQIMYERVWPNLSKSNQLNDQSNQLGINTEGQLGTQGGIAFTGSLLNYGSLTDDQGVRTGSAAHRRAWEAGHVDYHGRDSFTNIQEQLEKNIAQQQPQYHPSQQRETTPTNQNIQSTSGSANQRELTEKDLPGSSSGKPTEAATTTKKDENQSKK